MKNLLCRVSLLMLAGIFLPACIHVHPSGVVLAEETSSVEPVNENKSSEAVVEVDDHEDSEAERPTYRRRSRNDDAESELETLRGELARLMDMARGIQDRIQDLEENRTGRGDRLRRTQAPLRVDRARGDDSRSPIRDGRIRREEERGREEHRDHPENRDGDREEYRDHPEDRNWGRDEYREGGRNARPEWRSNDRGMTRRPMERRMQRRLRSSRFEEQIDAIRFDSPPVWGVTNIGIDRRGSFGRTGPSPMMLRGRNGRSGMHGMVTESPIFLDHMMLEGDAVRSVMDGHVVFLEGHSGMKIPLQAHHMKAMGEIHAGMQQYKCEEECCGKEECGEELKCPAMSSGDFNEECCGKEECGEELKCPAMSSGDFNHVEFDTGLSLSEPLKIENGFHDVTNSMVVEGVSGQPGGIVIRADHFGELEDVDVEFDMDIAELMGGDFEAAIMIEIDGNEIDLEELPSLEIIKEMAEKLRFGMRQVEVDEVLINKSGDDSPKKANKKKANKKKANMKKANKKKANNKKANNKKANNKKANNKKAQDRESSEEQKMRIRVRELSRLGVPVL